MRVGLISDTHGLLRGDALAALAGSDFIVHAGDIGDPAIIEMLAAIAPVTAVRGNNDRDRWANAVPETATLVVGGASVFVIHDIGALTIDPAEQRFRAVVSGHSHRPSIARRDGVLYVNPGSAGPRRFSLPISVGEIVVDANDVQARLIELPVASAHAPSKSNAAP